MSETTKTDVIADAQEIIKNNQQLLGDDIDYIVIGKVALEDLIKHTEAMQKRIDGAVKAYALVDSNEAQPDLVMDGAGQLLIWHNLTNAMHADECKEVLILIHQE